MTKVSEEMLPTIGTHKGVVESLKEESRDYGAVSEMKYVVSLRATDGDYPYSPLEKVFNHVLSMQSGFGKFLARVGVDMKPGADIDVQSVVGQEIAFDVIEKENGFLDIPSGSIQATA